MGDIVYSYGESVYMNITNKCCCSCVFCIRSQKDAIGSASSLWHDREPTIDEIIAAIDAFDLTDATEVVFCGYGEPTCRLDDMLAVAAEIRAKSPGMRIRLNTNGHSDLINSRDTSPEYEGAFDIVSISLNTPTAEKYQALCHSVYGEKSFDSLLAFAGRVKEFVPVVQLSAVKQTLNSEEIELCRKIAGELGVTLRLRDYIPPET